MKKIYQNIIMIGVFVAIFALLLYLIANSAQTPDGGVADPVGASADELIETDYVLGDIDAPVTIVEFSDFECPFCARFHEQAFQQIKEQYIDTGKVKFVYRDFPLQNHQKAPYASLAAECAGEQGSYWEMHDMLFTRGISTDYSTYESYAQELELDMEQFATCYSTQKYSGEIQRDLQDGINAGVKGTPAFFVGDAFVSGAQPFTAFEATINEQLLKANATLPE